MSQLTEYVKDQIWIYEYPVRFAGMNIFGRMTIIKLDDEALIVHSPCEISDLVKDEIDAIGDVKYIDAQGTKYIWEVAFFHRPSKTLILVDLLENIGDDYKHPTGRLLRFWWKVVFKMWSNPKAAPEYQMGWGKKDIVKNGLSKILSWNAQRVILAYGELIESNVTNILRSALRKILNA